MRKLFKVQIYNGFQEKTNYITCFHFDINQITNKK